MPPVSVLINEHCNSSFSEFFYVSEADVFKFIQSVSFTYCLLDPLPIGILKTHLEDRLPVITRNARTSLSSGVFQATFKHARIIPLLKKSNLDTNILSNYRSMSNIAFLGKVIERISVQQLQTYLSVNDLHTQMQSAYKRFMVSKLLCSEYKTTY